MKIVNTFLNGLNEDETDNFPILLSWRIGRNLLKMIFLTVISSHISRPPSLAPLPSGLFQIYCWIYICPFMVPVCCLRSRDPWAFHL